MILCFRSAFDPWVDVRVVALRLRRSPIHWSRPCQLFHENALSDLTGSVLSAWVPTERGKGFEYATRGRSMLILLNQRLGANLEWLAVFSELFWYSNPRWKDKVGILVYFQVELHFPFLVTVFLLGLSSMLFSFWGAYSASFNFMLIGLLLFRSSSQEVFTMRLNWWSESGMKRWDLGALTFPIGNCMPPFSWSSSRWACQVCNFFGDVCSAFFICCRNDLVSLLVFLAGVV